MTDTESTTIEIHHSLAHGKTRVTWETFASPSQALSCVRALLAAGISNLVLRGPPRYLSELELAEISALRLVRQ
jgi:hypothetical protein